MKFKAIAQTLPDSTHALAGQTVDIPEWSEP